MRDADRNRIGVKVKGRGPNGAAGSFINYRDALGLINIDAELIADGIDPFSSPWVFKGANLGQGSGHTGSEEPSKGL